MKQSIIEKDDYEYEVWLDVAEHNLQAVWEIHIDGLFVAISDWINYSDSLNQAEKLIEDISLKVKQGEFGHPHDAVTELHREFNKYMRAA